jgi:hypothetical protein
MANRNLVSEDEVIKRQQDRLRKMAQEELIKKKAETKRAELEEILGDEIRAWAASVQCSPACSPRTCQKKNTN